jgi:hypothetical protein
MARVESINDEGIAIQTLNKIQRQKVREIIATYNEKPADALYHVNEYCSRFSKFSVRRVCFDKQEAPTGIQIHTSNSVYLFKFKVA